MRKIFCFLILVGFCLGVGKLWYWKTNGFNISRLDGWTQELEGVWWNEEAEAILSQTFHYLARGRQAYAFVSEDGQYILKFPRGDICKIPFWLKAYPFAAKRERQVFRRAFRERCVLESARLSMEELKDATAMIAMNFSRSANHEKPFRAKKVKIIDRAGRSFQVPLASTYFVLQRKKDLFRDVIQRAAVNEGIQGVEHVIDVLFDVIVERTQKGILNRDGSFLRNYGFDDQRGYQTDIGSFFKAEGVPSKDLFFRSMELSVKPIRKWMAKMHPEWLPILDRKRELLLQTPSEKQGSVTEILHPIH